MASDLEHEEALKHDDRTLMGDMGTARRNVFNNPDKKCVLRILNLDVSKRTRRFPKYVKNAVAPLDKLQKQMTSGRLPEVSPRENEDCYYIHISSVVAHSHHDQDMHASPRRTTYFTEREP